MSRTDLNTQVNKQLDYGFKTVASLKLGAIPKNDRKGGDIPYQIKSIPENLHQRRRQFTKQKTIERSSL